MERHRACDCTRCGRKGGSTGTARSERREEGGRARGPFEARGRGSRGAAPPARAAWPLLALLLVVAAAFSTALQPQRAHADAIPNIGDKAYGTCYIENSWRENSQTYFNVGGFSGELAGAWAPSSLECLDHTAAAPTYTDADYEATVTAVNLREGWAEYSVYITPPDPTDGVTANEHGLIGYQHVGGTVRVKRSFAGGIELSKASSNTGISTGNECYSLAGAAYGVYRDAACADCWFTMATDQNGRWKTAKDLPAGTYWVKEIAPPAGYALDGTAYRVDVPAGGYARVNGGTVHDAPQADPAEALVEKRDAELEGGAGAGEAQGGASLAHAQYTISFYGGHRDTGDLSWMKDATPLRTWVMQTDEGGTVSLASGDGTFVDRAGRQHPYKLSGSDFYRDASGRIVLPLGTVTVQETAAPEGYLLPEDARVYARHVSGDGALETVRTYVAPVDPEQAMRGDVALTKIAGKDPVAGDGGIKDVLVGVDFQLINANDGPVARGDGSLAGPGEVAATITTDDRGYAATTGGALSYGTYLVHEVAATVPAGYDVIEDFAVTIAEDGQELYYVLEDGTGTPIRVVKVDAETGRQIAGHTTFRILDEDMQVVTFTRHYPAVSHQTAFTTDATGACMLPEKLNGGSTYYLQEIAAPDGYLLNDEPIPFTVDGTSEHTWANPLTIKLPDQPQRGSIVVSKADAEAGQGVAGCTYEVYAAGDIVTDDGTVRATAGELVACVKTGNDGTARTGELHLGAYEVAEAQQADGYQLDASRHAVALEYAGQTVAVTTAQADVADAPTRIEVRKTRAGSDVPVEGATFAWRLEGAEEVLGTGTTDVDGLLPVSYLAPGTYSFAEIEAPPGYLLDAAPQLITVDEDGLVQGSTVGVLSFENDCTKTAFYKVDSSTGLTLPGAALELYATDPDEAGAQRRELVEMWTSDGDPHLIEALPAGSYVLHEEIAPEGYLPAEDLAFTVEPIGGVQRIELADDRTKVDVAKVDAASEEPLPGAVLALADADGRFVDPREHLAGPAEVEVRELGRGEAGAAGAADGRGEAGTAWGWVSTTEPVRFEGLPTGELTLVEIEAPEGYRTADPVRFDVAVTAEVQTVTMADEAVGATYAQTGVELPARAGALVAFVTGCAAIAAGRRFKAAG